MILTEENQTNTEDNRVPKATGAFLGPLSVLVRQKKTWSPALLAGILWRAITNIDTHREVLKLLKRQPFAETVHKNPRFAFKYLAPHYIARCLTWEERSACFLYHHRRMHASLPDQILRQILLGDITVHQVVQDNVRYLFTVGLSRPCDKEGELSLNLQIDDEIIFLVSFSIVPGWVVKSAAPEVLFLTRIQGTPGCFPKIKMASAALHDVNLNGLLFAALQGFATAFDINEIAASSARDQTSFSEDLAAIFERAYDEFYLDLGMSKSEHGIFFGAIPIEGKPLELVKKNHRSRTKDQRRFKQEIQSAVARFFSQIAVHNAIVPEPIRLTPMQGANKSTSSSLPCPTLDQNPTL